MKFKSRKEEPEMIRKAMKEEDELEILQKAIKELERLEAMGVQVDPYTYEECTYPEEDCV